MKDWYESWHPNRWKKVLPKWNRLLRIAETGAPTGHFTQSSFQKMVSELHSQYNASLMRFPVEKRPYDVSSAFSQEINIAGAVLHFWNGNRNCYALEEHLYEQLAHTSAGDILIEDIRFPHQYLFVAFPKGNGVSLYGPDNEIDGVYVDSSLENRLSLFILGRPSSPVPTRSNWPSVRDLYTSFVIEDTRGLTVAEAVSRAFRDNMKNLSLQLPSAEMDKLRDEVASEFDIDVVYDRSLHLEGREKALMENFAAGLQAASTAISLCCYLTSGGESEERWPEGSHSKLIERTMTGTEKQRNYARSELERYSILPFHYVKGPAVERPDNPSGRSVAVHWRRGHFRAVAVGEGRTRRELRWIKPTLVNAGSGKSPDDRPRRMQIYRDDRPLPRDLH